MQLFFNGLQRILIKTNLLVSLLILLFLHFTLSSALQTVHKDTESILHIV